MRWLALASLTVLLAVGFPACGGGSGDDGGGGETPCTPPGALTTLALEGGSASDSDGGSFAPFTPLMPFAAGNGGWAAFVAGIVGGDTTEILYAVQPDGTRVRVLAQGDVAPDATAGTLASIEAIRVSPQGWILALVTVADGGPSGPTFGLVTAHVTGGGVGEIHGVIWDDVDLASTGLPGTLADLNESGLHVATFGTSFFKGTTDGGDDGFWKVGSDGTGLALLLGTGSPLGGVHSARALYATALSAGSQRYAVVVEQNDDTPGTKGVYVGRLTGGGVTAAALEDEEIADGDKIQDIRADQSLVVYQGDAATGVLFEAISDQLEMNVLLASTASGANTITVARENDDAPPQSGTTLDLGAYGDNGLLNNGPSCNAPILWADLVGATPPVTLGLFALKAGAAQPVVAFLDGVPAPPDGVDAFSASFLGPGVDGRVDVSEDGAIAFSNVLTSGQIGVFWSIPGCGLFAVARSGGPAPSGGSFGTQTTWRQTTANGVLVFLAPVTGGGNGLFRQGP